MISSFWRPHYTTYMHITFLKLCENGNFSHSQSGNFHERCVGVCACPCVMMFTSALFTVRLFCVCKRSTRFWSRGLRALNCTFVVTRERKYAGYARVLLFGCQILDPSIHNRCANAHNTYPTHLCVPHVHCDIVFGLEVVFTSSISLSVLGPPNQTPRLSDDLTRIVAIRSPLYLWNRHFSGNGLSEGKL